MKSVNSIWLVWMSCDRFIQNSKTKIKKKKKISLKKTTFENLIIKMWAWLPPYIGPSHFTSVWNCRIRYYEATTEKSVLWQAGQWKVNEMSFASTIKFWENQIFIRLLFIYGHCKNANQNYIVIFKNLFFYHPNSSLCLVLVCVIAYIIIYYYLYN